MSLFRLRWALPRVLSPAYYRRLKAILRNPAMFYAALAIKLVPQLRTPRLTLRFHNGQQIAIPSFMSLYVFSEIFLDGIYDVDVAGVGTIIDIGANTGMFVLRAKQLWPDATIIAYEPEPENFIELCRTIESNGLRDVIPMQAAVAAVAGSATLYRHPRNIGGHSTVHHHSGGAVEVPARTLEDALDLLPGGTCDLLKVDCEGAEEAIFRSLTPTSAERIRAIVYEPEWHLYSVPDLNFWLGKLGFQVGKIGASVVALR